MESATSTMTPAPYRVAANERETPDSRTLTFVPTAGERIGYEPGQFTMIYAFGAGEVPISVSGDPADGRELVQTVRAVGPATRAICQLKPGDEVGVRGPFGRGWPGPGRCRRDLLLIAGGLGMAPLRPALYAALAQREAFGRVTLLYGGREPDQLLFSDEIEAWRRENEIDCELIVDVAGADWHGDVGFVPTLIDRLELDPGATTALICGPELMMRFAADALLERGVEAESVYVSLERNMRCAVGHCGHCQWGGSFICRDGPVFDWSLVGPRIGVREL